ncbi:sulfotransferase family protein [Alteromonas halophila]|uniref:Sulfotransferase n=1 Tax=Alteromonas halophila TaxID=516698 RepID=A0A918MYQ1_9ALTE|nr:sulfotransferase [Alteromonas halophila]GGW86979.1 hypothetical protein GCM10007391_20970 [Alteromonas halophila]
MCNKNFIFLAGHHRSGTSLLHEILKEHPEISGFSNTGVPEDEGQHLQTVYKPATEFGGPGKYIFNPASQMTEEHPLATSKSAELLLAQWGKYYDNSKSHFIEKSPPNLIRTRFFQKIFPNSKFIVILRHPIAVSYATKKWSKTSVKSLIEHTVLGYEVFMEDKKKLNNVYVLRYEDFVKNPQVEIDAVFDFLGLKSISVNHDVKKNVNDKYFDMWMEERRKLRNKIALHVSGKVERRAIRYGYSLLEKDKVLPLPAEFSNFAR